MITIVNVIEVRKIKDSDRLVAMVEVTTKRFMCKANMEALLVHQFRWYPNVPTLHWSRENGQAVDYHLDGRIDAAVDQFVRKEQWHECEIEPLTTT